MKAYSHLFQLRKADRVMVRQRRYATRLPPDPDRVLHLGGRHRRWRAGHGDASGWVDDWDRVAATCRGGLVQLHVGLVVVEYGARGHKGGRGGVEREPGSDGLGLLSRRRLRRVAREGGSLRCTGDGDQVILSQQTGAELEVVFELERAGRFEFCTECRHGRGFVELLHAAHASELALGVLRHGQTGSSAVAAAMAVVDCGCGVRRVCIEVVVS